MEEVRADGYEMFRRLSPEATSCRDLESCLPDVEIAFIRVEENAPALGKTLAEIEMRKNYGVTLLALRRNHRTLSVPDADVQFLSQDLLFVAGQYEKIDELKKLFQDQREITS